MKTLIFAIAIEPGDENHAFGVVVPDLPGCLSAGDTLEEAYSNSREAIESHLEVMVDERMPIAKRRPLAAHQANPDYAGWLWGIIEVRDIVALKKSVRINISLPEALVEEIDSYAKTHHLSRSGFLAKAASQVMASGQ